MSATDAALALERALREAGIAALVEPRDRLAVLLGTDIATVTDAAARERAVSLARAHGFTNVAVEIDPGAAPLAPLRRD